MIQQINYTNDIYIACVECVYIANAILKVMSWHSLLFQQNIVYNTLKKFFFNSTSIPTVSAFYVYLCMFVK